MDFVAFPLRIGQRGSLERSVSPEESIVQLIRIMASTPERGWSGSTEFGLRDTLAGLLARPASRLSAIAQLNTALEDLGIDWAQVENIEIEPPNEFGKASYMLTLSYRDKGAEIYRFSSL